jgi:hypothetical protein
VTLDLFAGLELKEAGIAQASASRNDLINKVRAQLELIARGRADRCVTADDYQPFLEAIGLSSEDLGNAAGSVFKSDNWEFTGHFVPSKRVSNRGRYVRVWRLK